MNNLQNLPNELILEQLLLLSFKDLNNLCSTNINIQNVCNEYEDLIYTNLLKKDFLVLSPKLLYKLFKYESDNNYDSILLKRNHFKIWKKAIDSEKINEIISFNLIDINVKDNNDNTPLMYALKFSTPEIINKILDLNPDIDAINNIGWTPLIYALRKSTPEIIHRILDLKPNVKKLSLIDVLVLYPSNLEITSKILNLNPDVNIKENIKYDLFEDDDEEFDDNTNIFNIEFTPLTYALQYSTSEIINKILDYDPNVDGSLNGALQYSTPEIINRILYLNTDINISDEDKMTPLMVALQFSTPEIINKILDLNPDINIQDKKGWSPLMFALQFSTPEIINKILDLNPDINAINNKNQSVLMIALRNSTPEIINRILDLEPEIIIGTLTTARDYSTEEILNKIKIKTKKIYTIIGKTEITPDNIINSATDLGLIITYNKFIKNNFKITFKCTEESLNKWISINKVNVKKFIKK